MSTKHTPGPWTLPHFAEPGVNCQCGYVLTADMMGAVCTVHASGEGNDWLAHGDNPKFEEAVANARLIAAAPEMLEACQLALQLRQTLHESWFSSPEDDSSANSAAFEADCIEAAIRAAIAKAEA